MGSAPSEPYAGPAVSVLKTTHVADYDVTVLEASDVNALTKWLNQHGYQARPSLTQWFQKYIEAKWKFTAFKFNPVGKRADALEIPAVRLSFKTDRPYFPYREPTDQQEFAKKANAPRLLRIFFVSRNRVTGKIGDGNAPWPGRETYANRSFSAPSLLAGAVPDGEIHRISWLSEFNDSSSPRPATDELYFQDGGSFWPNLPMPRIIWSETYFFPVEILFAALIAVFVNASRRSERK